MMLLEVWVLCGKCKGSGQSDANPWGTCYCAYEYRTEFTGVVQAASPHPGYVRILRPIAEVLAAVTPAAPGEGEG